MTLTDFAYSPQPDVRFSSSLAEGRTGPVAGFLDIMDGSLEINRPALVRPAVTDVSPCTSDRVMRPVQYQAEPAKPGMRFRPKGNALVHEAIVHGKEAELRRIFRRSRQERRMCSVLDVIRRLL